MPLGQRPGRQLPSRPESLDALLHWSDHFGVRWRSLLLPLALVAIAAKLIQLGITREGVGPFEYLTLALIVALLLRVALLLSRRAFRQPST
jgi:hypothetical protein